MMRIVFFILLLTSSASAYVGEEICGAWGNIKHETSLTFDCGASEEYYSKNIMTGTFRLYTGGNFADTGSYEFKGTSLSLHYTGYENIQQSFDKDYVIKYTVKMGITKAGSRYLLLTSGRGKQFTIGPLYYRDRK